MSKFVEAMKKIGLAPLLCDNPRILVLGSLPGDRSLELQEYYGHTRNRFWKVIAAVSGEDEPASYEEKKAMLRRAGIALWDIYQAAEREGSLDADIRQGAFNDILGLLEKYPTIRTIACNGRTAENAFITYLKAHASQARTVMQDIEVHPMPSTSPANAGWSLERLVEKWKLIFIFA